MGVMPWFPLASSAMHRWWSSPLKSSSLGPPEAPGDCNKTEPELDSPISLWMLSCICELEPGVTAGAPPPRPARGRGLREEGRVGFREGLCLTRFCKPSTLFDHSGLVSSPPSGFPPFAVWIPTPKRGSLRSSKSPSVSARDIRRSPMFSSDLKSSRISVNF